MKKSYGFEAQYRYKYVGLNYLISLVQDGGPQLGGECSGLQNISEFSSLWPELSTTFVIDGAMKTSGNYWLI